jgi:hypothetical protein
MGLVLFRVTQPLPNNGGFSGSPVLALRKYTVTDLLKAFLGKGSVNNFQRATMEDVSQ